MQAGSSEVYFMIEPFSDSIFILKISFNANSSSYSTNQISLKQDIYHYRLLIIECIL